MLNLNKILHVQKNRFIQLLSSYSNIPYFFKKTLQNYSYNARYFFILFFIFSINSFILISILLIFHITYEPILLIKKTLHLQNFQKNNLILEKQKELYVNEAKIKHNDTLLTIFTRLGVTDETALKFIKSNNLLERSIMQLRADKRIMAHTLENGQLIQLSTILTDRRNGPVIKLNILREGNKFKVIAIPITLEQHIEMRSCEIYSSLFAATDNAQIPDNIATQIVNMFATNINFAVDLRRGDRFNIIYESFWNNGTPIRTGRLLAGEFINADSIYQAIWFDDKFSKISSGYYSFNGKSLKKAFLKSPLAFTRISSGFSMRKHPIRGLWKKHNGIDFAAPHGTPIHASGDGIIDFIGKRNGYGNIIVIKHWNHYSTAYGHMNRFATGIHKGIKVQQGDIIGYVGMTGWATGPHLHYEFRIKNIPCNPLSIHVPNTKLLVGHQLQRFHIIATDMSRRLLLMRSTKNSLTSVQTN